MNIIPYLSQESDLLNLAIDRLRSSTGIEATILPGPQRNSDAIIRLSIAGKCLQYAAHVKRKVDRYVLLVDVMQPAATTQLPPLLISTSLSPEMAARCKELGLQFIDAAGNAYINDGAGILIFVTGKRTNAPLTAATDSSTVTPAALKMMFSFLAAPDLLNAPYRDIAFQATVSTGAIGKAFDTLEARHLIGTTPSGSRSIRSPQLFLNEWASGYASRLRPKLKKFRFASQSEKSFEHWSPAFRASAIGGEVGAKILTKHLAPEKFTVYLDMNDRNALRDMIKEFRLSAAPDGPIEVVEMFWNPDYFTEWFPTVPPHLIYADLLSSHESRNIEVAKLIAQKVVAHVQDTGR